MSKRLRLLLIEDSGDDEVLLLRCLRDAGYHVTATCVQTADELRAALSSTPWDLVISDYHLPSFTAPEAFAILGEYRLDLPFIIVSGTVGEDAAVRAMKAGVHDYIVKGNLARLVPAIEREVREARLRAEQRHMREQLLIADRMASAGALAAGVAHEINNPLAVAAANWEFIRMALDKARELSVTQSSSGDVTRALDALLADIAEPMRDTREAMHRIRDIVRDIKLFSRPQEEALEAVDVREVIESSIRLSWNELRHRARVVRDLQDVPPIVANQSRMGQVLLNLIVNAAQALPEGRAEANEIRLVSKQEGGRVVVEVHDSGVGIPPENLARVFDPFFTTKSVGEGTGLGLSICHRIVSDLGGEITVTSEVGKGTAFRLTFPAAPVITAPISAQSSRAPDSSPRGRVLVVDDEVPLVRTLKRILMQHHDVTVATSGREALTRIDRGERFDAILSDVMMPEVTGMELHQQLLTSAPDQAACMVFMTGGAFTVTAREYLDHVPNLKVEKPFEAATITAAVSCAVRTTIATRLPSSPIPSRKTGPGLAAACVPPPSSATKIVVAPGLFESDIPRRPSAAPGGRSSSNR